MTDQTTIQILTHKKSGKFYRIHGECTIKGEPAYVVVGQRDGKDFGPVRWIKRSAFV